MKTHQWAIIILVCVAAVAYLALVALKGNWKVLGGAAVPKRWTVDVATFPDELQSYGGAAVCTPDGQTFGWNGNRDVSGNRSLLIYMDHSDTHLKGIPCAGSCPDGVFFPSVALDAERRTLYAFGGYGNAYYADMYRIRFGSGPVTWEKLEPPSPLPSPRNGAGMIYDAAKHRLIVCCGDAGPGTTFTPLGDCWQFDVVTSTWRQLPLNGTPPPARWHCAMTVDQSTRKAYLFGGAGRVVRFDDALYELDLTTDIWRRIRTVGSAPPSLQGASLTFDEKNHVLVLAGGLRHTGFGHGTLSQVWIFDPAVNQWDETDCGVALRRRDHLAAYDPAAGQHILIGGRDSGTVGNFYERGVLSASDARLTVRSLLASSASQPVY